MTIRSTVRIATFGRSILTLSTLPASPGGTVAGIVRVPKLLQPTGSVELHLTCVEQKPSSGEDSGPKFTRYQDSQKLNLPPTSKPGLEIPVHFTLPRGVPITVEDGRTKITWQLEVTAPSAEVNYLCRFKIPVFVVNKPIAPSAVECANSHRYR